MDTPIASPRPRAPRLLLALAGIAIALLVLPAGASAAVVSARPADSFVDSIGVNTHTYYSDKNYYSRYNDWKPKLAQLGVRHIRENLVPDRPDQYKRLNELAAMGVKSTLIVGDPGEGRDGLANLVSILRNQLRGTVEAAEGTNEYDLWGGSDWLPRVREYQEWLYSAIKSDPVLAALPVVGPSIVHSHNQTAVGDISANLDYGNIHSYPDGYGPESNLNRHLGAAARNSAGKPVMATESGYHTAVGWRGEHNPTSESAAATYLPRMYLEYFRRGIARTFAYELLDQEPGAREREDSFGLLRHDLSEKPAFGALRNLIAILEDRGPTFSPAPLSYSLGGDSDDVNALLLQKRDGSYYLALWRTTEIWDPEDQRPLPDRARTVSIELDRTVEGADLYRPTASPQPTAIAGDAGGISSLSLELGAAPVVVRLAVGPPAGRISLQVSRRSVPAGGRIAVTGRLPASARGQATRIAIQHLRGRTWSTVGYGRSRANGKFRRSIRLSPARFGRVPKLRAIASVAKPSRSVRVRIRKRGQRPQQVTKVSPARAVATPGGQ